MSRTKKEEPKVIAAPQDSLLNCADNIKRATDEYHSAKAQLNRIESFMLERGKSEKSRYDRLKIAFSVPTDRYDHELMIDFSEPELLDFLRSQVVRRLQKAETNFYKTMANGGK